MPQNIQIAQSKNIQHWYKTPQGEAAATLLHERIAVLWPEPHTDATLLIGPECMADILFPKQRIKTLSGERAAENIPFGDKSFDYIVIAHTLEFLADEGALLEECQRCLVPSGKILLIAPNRRGSWARAEKTPFGVGKPYTVQQLKAALQEAMLRPMRTDMTLFMPPLNYQCVVRAAKTFERWGRVVKPWCSLGGGVLLVEGRKDAVGGTPVKTRQKVKPARGKPALGAAKVRG